MIKKTYLLCILFGALWLLLGTIPAFGTHCCGYINEKTIPVSPSMPVNTITNWIYESCYDIETLRPLDCKFTLKITGLKSPADNASNNGGHKHNFDTHPLIEPPSESLKYRYIFAGGAGPDKDATPLGIDGQTQNDEAIIAHPLPQVAGMIMMESVVTAPPGWWCASRCFTEKSWKDVYTIDVGIQGFSRLEDSGDYHVVVRGGTDTHPEGSYGTPDTIKTLRKIAKEYFKSTGRRLSINDLSLPKGGLFDINSDYTTPHIEHRTGTDADLNRCDGSGQFCPTCKFLREVVQAAAKGQLRPSLKCESAGRKHIDFN